MQMQVRHAQEKECDYIVELSRRVQDKLNRSGSLQEIGPIPFEVVVTYIEQNSAYVMEVDGSLVGSVFVQPAPVHVADWGFDNPAYRYWFLHKLMIEPEQQGKRLGRHFVEAIKKIIGGDPNGVLTLDCWAGNANLRQLYTELGFKLHGVFDEGDYEIAVFVWPI
jgi:GNAT superfamily N-acetyltransferase